MSAIGVGTTRPPGVCGIYVRAGNIKVGIGIAIARSLPTFAFCGCGMSVTIPNGRAWQIRVWRIMAGAAWGEA